MFKFIRSSWFVITLFLAVIVIIASGLIQKEADTKPLPVAKADSVWEAPSLFTDFILEGKEREQVMYGEELIAHTSKYLGPHGSVMQITNGMNCQNCHLDAGTRPWGNNYGAVASTYPKYRERSGSMENIYKRVNDCFERSLNGKSLDTTSTEMQAITAYMKWLGKEVPKGKKPVSSGLEKLSWLNRAADTVRGRKVYSTICQTCHGTNGEGQLNLAGTEYTYPPLWGANSYNDGAGLYRISNFAGYIKSNMPFNQASHGDPRLSDEEAWDVAAFVNSKPRPHKDQSADYADISKKPVDFPFGPYADSFSQKQHKYGPFLPIVKTREKQ